VYEATDARTIEENPISTKVKQQAAFKGTRTQIKNKVSLLVNQNQSRGLKSQKRLFTKFQNAQPLPEAVQKLNKGKLIRLRSQEGPTENRMS
jgi:hypothetical protein